MTLTVFAAFAHPDDEGFGCGGTLAALVAGGHRVTLICATNGDVGEISDPALATPETLWQVRQRELRTAMDVTGIEDVRFLNYRDSGMAGTEDNDHQSSLFQAPEAKVVEQVAAVIRETRPDVVITHDPTGGYGHPDHVTHLSSHRVSGGTLQRRKWTATLLPLLPTQCVPAHVAGHGRGRHPPSFFRRRCRGPGHTG